MIDLRRIQKLPITVRLLRICERLDIKTVHSLLKLDLKYGQTVAHIYVGKKVVAEIEKVRRQGLKPASWIVGTPDKATVQIEHKGKRYEATEEDCRYLQALACRGAIDTDEYDVIDVDEFGNEYKLEWNPHQFTFQNSFSSNIYSFNSACTLEVIGVNRKKRTNT